MLEYLGHLRAELRATPGTDDVDGRRKATRAKVHFDDIGEVNDVNFKRNIFSASTIRHPLAVPALEDIRQRLPDIAVQTHPVGKNSGRTAMRLDQIGNLVACREHKSGRTDAALPARQSAAHVTDHQTQERQPGHVHGVRVGPPGDVVAEERRKLVGVGVTADPTEQVGVVHRGALLGVEAHSLGDARRDQ